MHKNAEYVLFGVIALMACQLFLMYSKLGNSHTDLKSLQMQLDQFYVNLQSIQQETERLEPLRDAMANIEKTVDHEVASHPDFEALKRQLVALAKGQDTRTAVTVAQTKKSEPEQIIIDHEKLENFLAMKQIPASILELWN